MIILSIETSCDETAIALVEASGGIRAPKFKVLKNLVASQIPIHRPFGGVVPMLAKREHTRNLPLLFKKIEGFAKLKVKSGKWKVDLMAVTVGPGLEPALWTGIQFARELISNLQFPISKLIGVNHLEGHLYSFLLAPNRYTLRAKRSIFPAIALLVSGGHTELLLMKSLTEWKKLGATRDDAAGEAFDKVARMLRLPYPGGPEIEKLSIYGSSTSINFPRPMLNQKNYDFSFSGLKTAVFYYLRDSDPKLRIHPNSPNNTESIRGIRINSGFSYRFTADVAASFQAAVIDVLVQKTIRAAKEFKAKSVILCGGVAANKTLSNELKETCRLSRLTFYSPAAAYNTDNAAMIAAAAYINALTKKKYKLEAKGDLDI